MKCRETRRGPPNTCGHVRRRGGDDPDLEEMGAGIRAVKYNSDRLYEFQLLSPYSHQNVFLSRRPRIFSLQKPHRPGSK